MSIKDKLAGKLPSGIGKKPLSEIKGILDKIAKQDKELYKIIAAMAMSKYGRKMVSSDKEGKRKLLLFNLLSFLHFLFLAGICVMLYFKIWWGPPAVVLVYFFITNPLQTGLNFDLAARMIRNAEEL